MFELTLFQIYLMIHLLGVVIGLGGALFSDVLFLTSIKKRKLTTSEVRIIQLAGHFVVFGLMVLIISGVLLFSTNIEKYLYSAKFMAKMSIVFVLFLNGLVFHYFHIPKITKHVETNLMDAPSFRSSWWFLLIGGAISAPSWLLAFMLGFIKKLPYSYGEIMGVYVLILAASITGALFMGSRIIPLRHKKS